ncbi:MAG: hypothetical protein AB7G39_12475 [Alphaproteobacteria bacterium]
MSSVAATFQTQDNTAASAEIFVSELGPAPTPEEVMEGMRRLWVTRIPVVEVTVLDPGRLMEMTLPVNELFIGGDTALRADRQGLMTNVARALQINAGGFVNELEFVIGTEMGRDGLLSLSDGAATKRASLFAQALVDYGAPPGTVSVGARGGDPRRIRLRFYVRAAGRAHVDFHELVETPQ